MSAANFRDQDPLSSPPFYPDARLPVVFCGALTAAALRTAVSRPAAVTVLLSTAFVAAAAAVTLSLLTARGARFCLPLAALALGLAAGILLAGNAAQQSIDPAQLTAGHAVEGHLIEDASRYADSSTSYRLKVMRVIGSTGVVESGGVLLVSVPGGAELSAGRRLRVSYTPDHIRTTGSSVILYSRAIDELGWTAAHYAYRDLARQALFARIEAMGYRPGGLFRALVTGSRSRLTREQQRLFRESGSSHLLALSGMHLGIIAAVSFLVAKRVLGRRAAFMATLAACIIYIYLVGMRPSLLRALAMLALAGSVRLSGRRSDAVNSFALAISTLILLMPSLVHQLSFQLSALSIVGILGPGVRIRALLAPFLPRRVAMGLAAAAGAQLVTAPLALAVFGTVYPVALMSSLVLIPLVSLFVWSGLLWLALTLAVGQVPAALLLLPRQAWLIQSAARLFAGVPSAVPSVTTSVVTITVVALVVGVLYYRDGLLLLRRRPGTWPP